MFQYWRVETHSLADRTAIDTRARPIKVRGLLINHQAEGRKQVVLFLPHPYDICLKNIFNRLYIIKLWQLIVLNQTVGLVGLTTTEK